MLRTPSQIGVREKYLITVRTVTAGSGVGINGVSSFIINSFSEVGSVALAADVTNADGFDAGTVTSGTLYRDMGRSITVVDADGNHLALYRNVQEVAGADTEGVPNATGYNANIYLRVWAADGANVGVARLG